MRNRIPVVVLASGGIDSTALIHRYVARGEPVHALHFSYGQPSEMSELRAVRAVCAHYKIDLKVVRLGFKMFLRGYEMIGRNTIFVLVSASLGSSPLRIGLAINRGPDYYDISPRFVSDCQKILDGYWGGTVVLEAPFVQIPKSEIIRYSRRRRIPLSLTYSCLKKSSPPCGRCPSCMDRKKYLGT